MNNDDLDKLTQDKIDDAFFSYVGACHIENINKEMDTADDVNNPKQKELDDKIGKLIQTYDRRLNHEKLAKSARKASKRAAIIVICIIVSSVALILSVDALKTKFLNFFIDAKEEYSKIEVTDNINLNDQNETLKTLRESEDLVNCYIPLYIPDNFSVQKIIKQVDTVIILFKDSKSNSLVFEQSSDLNKEFMIDTENATTEKMSILGQEAIIVEKGDTLTLLWNNGEKVFNIYGQTSKEKILKIAESLYQKN